MILNGRFLTTLVMFVLFAGACLLALGLPPKAAFMPLLIGIPGALLCAAQLVLDLRRAPDAPPEAEDDDHDGAVIPPDPDGARSELEIFIWLGLFTFAILGFGFILGGPVVVFAFVRFSSREPWRSAAFAAAGTFAILYGVFIKLLELSLFQGLILERLLP